MISYVLPTRDRAGALATTLGALGALPAHAAEVIVVDNASREPAAGPHALGNGLPVRVLRRTRNEGAAGRNAGVRASDPASEWIVMLDDDSRPSHLGFLNALREQPADVLALQAEVWLGGHELPRRHEAGGLPEVFIGCGVAVRREAFLDAGGYDPTFGYYAEEYDLAARFLRAGGRVAFDRRFEVVHDKCEDGRRMSRIVRRLVRNNVWVMQRHAPERVRREEIARTVARYGRIAGKEYAAIGYARGLLEASCSLVRQARTPLPGRLWDRFTGRAAAMAGLQSAWERRRFRTAVVVAPGKNAHVVRECLAQFGVRITTDERDAEAVVIGTLSPGPALDASALLAGEARLVTPWPGGATRTLVRVRAVSPTLVAA